ncbi:hypothetical protein BDN70DRAFT_940114 [Pholiota conissans]|uniref:Uncharacterized protein n=1 Tax=Pholiota conissans TaxID=109636 RepID=A0A9P6CQB8_9AGAR|nr:hypothetical protein BDN70DRAFT_940114 [Pholiota conissans]
MQKIRPIIKDTPHPQADSSHFPSHSSHQQSLTPNEYDMMTDEVDYNLVVFSDAIPSRSELPAQNLADPSPSAQNLANPSPSAQNLSNPSPPTHLQPRSSTNSSLRVQTDVELINQRRAEKQAMSAKLNALTSMLFGACEVCWVGGGIIRTPHAQKILKCEGETRTYISNLKEWIDLKKLLKPPQRYAYCHSCGLPMNEFRPPNHRISSSENSRSPCEYDDFVCQIVWAIRQKPEWWHKATTRFTDLNFYADKAAYARWLLDIPHADAFNNSIYLILWFYDQQQELNRTHTQ